MPCNGIAVATGRVEENLAKILFEIFPAETIQAIVVEFLKKQFPAYVGSGAVSARYGTAAINFNIGLINVIIYDSGDIAVTGNVLTPTEAGQIKEAVTDLIKGLAGKALQTKLVNALKKSGVKVGGQKTAPNGSLVMVVEL